MRAQGLSSHNGSLILTIPEFSLMTIRGQVVELDGGGLRYSIADWMLIRTSGLEFANGCHKRRILAQRGGAR